MDECTVTSGFLIEKTFGRMCREFLPRLEYHRPDLLNKGCYSWPRTDRPAGEMSKQYRGLQREPLQCWTECLRGSGAVEPTEQELAASLFLMDFEKAGKGNDDFVFSLADARELLRQITGPIEREIIWARRMDADAEPPGGAI